MSKANYIIEVENDLFIIIRDMGPWDLYMTVTNDAEGVVSDLADRLAGRRLFYYDTDDQLDELVVKNKVFAGFKPGKGE